MGLTTSVHWQSRKDIVHDRIKPWEFYDTKRDRTITSNTLAHCVRGNCLWKVVEHGWYAGQSRDWIIRQHTFIALDLIQNYGKETGWGYKELDESVGPYYYSCPLKYLSMQPRVECQTWRKAVIAYHAKQTMTLHVGLIVGLSGCTPNIVRIEQTGRKILASSQDGNRYQIKRSLLSGQVYDTWPVNSGAVAIKPKSLASDLTVKS